MFQSIKYTEFGIFDKMFKCLKMNTELKSSKSVKIFDNLDDFMSESTKYKDLLFLNFRSIFFVYFVLCFLNFVIFFANLFLKKLI